MFVRNSYFIISFILALLLSKDKINEQYATLNIPVINLEEKIYQKDSEYNSLKHGLYLLPESTNLENNNSNIIIASHSGNAKTSYFKNLNQLKINDEIKIIKENNIYIYKVIKIYNEIKDGNINIKKYNIPTLTLVTCQKGTNDLQLVISAIYTGKLEKNNKNTSFIDKIRIFFKIKKEICLVGLIYKIRRLFLWHLSRKKK